MAQIEIPNGQSIYVDVRPDTCPHCLKGTYGQVVHVHSPECDGLLEFGMKCSRSECGRLFIAVYDTGFSSPFLTRVIPPVVVGATLPKRVCEISEKFTEVFRQSEVAEQSGLTQICGAGYRRALECLIKDWLISEALTERDDIEKEYLGFCIESRVKDPRVKECAKRAAWLGNDETHYVRRWVDKDLQDLKTLIRLVVNWIDSELLTGEYQASMPR